MASRCCSNQILPFTRSLLLPYWEPVRSRTMSLTDAHTAPAVNPSNPYVSRPPSERTRTSHSSHATHPKPKKRHGVSESHYQFLRSLRLLQCVDEWTPNTCIYSVMWLLRYATVLRWGGGGGWLE